MNKDKETRNSKALKSFVKYCEGHPSERFWQALLNWSGLPYIAWTNLPPSDWKDDGFKAGDTFYWEELEHISNS
jgi:hypothetical protein